MSKFRSRKPAPHFVVVADLHLHHLPDWRLEWCNWFVDWLLQLQNDERYLHATLVLLGDVFELRDKLDARILNQFLRMVGGWTTRADVVWVAGQHDSYVPGMATLADLHIVNERVLVVDHEIRPYNFPGGKCYFVPFARQLDDYARMLKPIPNGATVLTHMPVKEVLERYGAKEPNAISVKLFDRFKVAYSGDIHHGQTIRNLTYIGAPSQRDWRDEGVEGCIGLIYPDGSLERLPVKHPKHVKIKSRAQLRNLDDSVTFLRVAPDVELSDQERAKLSKQLGIKSIEDMVAPVIELTDGELDKEQTPDQVMDTYLQKQVEDTGGISKTTLLQAGLEFLNAAADNTD